MVEWKQTKRKPGNVISWDEKAKELGPIKGDAALVKKIWEDVDGFAYMYIWQILLSF